MGIRISLGSVASGTALAAALLAGASICEAGGTETVAVASQQAQADDPVIVRVDGIEIRESDLRAADRAMGRNLSMQPEGRRNDVINFLIDTVVFSKAAPAPSAAEEAEIGKRITIARNRIIMEQMLMTAGAQAVSDEAVRKAYDGLIAAMVREPQLRLHMLEFLVPQSADKDAADAAAKKAAAAYQRIVKGEAFDAVARDMSDDPTTRKNGGNRGFVTRAMMGKDIADVAYALEKGKVSPPIKTAAGWHLVMIDGEHVPPKPDFQMVRGRIESNLARQAQMALTERLRSNARIERLDKKPVEAGAHPKD
ncbi:peptidylprolyl isomerase [Rhodopseudomonas sp. NSM]|uniref:peptidylprolyl isomerase n=1 Tax=Rhodopseudomonas sp. NSM TaxID=3457630 RepID=UPI004036A1AD